MDLIKEHINWCEVYVTFASLVNDDYNPMISGAMLSEAELPPNCVVMQIADYPTKDAFLAAAVEAVSSRTGLPAGELHFTLKNENFCTQDYLKSNHISSRIWDLLCMNMDDIDMVYTYHAAFDIDPLAGERAPLELLNYIKSNDLFVRYQDESEDQTIDADCMVEAYNHVFRKNEHNMA